MPQPNHILAISGWAQAPDALQSIAPHAETVDYVDSQQPADIAAQLTKTHYDAVIGWSLGGVLARVLLGQRHIQADRLVLIGAPVQFVRDEALHEAMPADTYQQFYTNYQQDPERTITRFAGLVAKGDAKEEAVRRGLKVHPRVADNSAWLRWLDWLASYRSQPEAYQALPPTLVVHGGQDAIVPSKQAELLAGMLPKAQLWLMSHAAHAPHLHDAQGLKARIEQFIAK